MLFTIDRLQFNGEELYAFEFFNTEKEECNKKFIEDKVLEIRKYIGKGIDKFFYIKYDDSFTTFKISEFSDNGITFTYSYDEFAEWFISINSGQYLRHESKTI